MSRLQASVAMDGDSERTIVIAMDGSHYSAFAFDWFMKNVHRTTDHVIIVHCPEYNCVFAACGPMGTADPITISTAYQEEEKHVKELLDKFAQRFRDTGIGGNVKCATGIPGPVILKIADDENAAMIITGSRGMGSVRRTFLGSVSDYVVHHSHVPVIVCRHKLHVTQHGHKHYNDQ